MIKVRAGTAMAYAVEAVKKRALEPLYNLKTLNNVLVGSLDDTWPYLIRAILLSICEPDEVVIYAMKMELREHNDGIFDGARDDEEVRRILRAAIDAIMNENEESCDWFMTEDGKRVDVVEGG